MDRDQSKRKQVKSWRLWVIGLLCAYLFNGSVMAAPSAALGYTPKYPANFRHFDYVNPNAPKGGELRLSVMGNYDGLNPYLLKGIAAEGVGGLVVETLMEQAWDEPYSLYPLLAEDIDLAKDRLSVSFRLNKKARFSDGSPVTAQDVKFSFDTLKSDQAHPMFRFYWSDIKRAVAVDTHTVRFEFARVNPELYLLSAQIPVFSQQWVGTRAFDKVVNETPVGSGPYVVDRFDLGKNIHYRRDPNYWGKDLPSRRGMFNFDRISYKYYLDSTAQLEAFKAGEYDFSSVTSSKQWAREYQGAKFTSGQIKREELKHRNNAGMQGFIFNTRNDLFKDWRVRRAIALAFDFEWSNDQLFFNQYTRIHSYFSNSELASSGLPKGDELKLLEPYRSKLPARVFNEVWQAPSTRPPNSLRANLLKAKGLLEEAGWRVKAGVLQNAQGKKFEFEFLLAQGEFERILAPFSKNLEKLGIRMRYRTVDVALYKERRDNRNFDMMVESVGQSQSPGNEQINYWHSSSADQKGSDNLIGIKDPVVDALIDKVIYAPDRGALITAVHALDRVLLHGDYMVPNWYIATHRVAYVHTLMYPKTAPLYYEATAWAIKTWWKKP